jgi:hypothetical protein
VFSGLPNMLTIHGYMRPIVQVNRAKPFSFQWLAARLEPLTIPRSCGVICSTHYTQRAVQNLARCTWMVPNAAAASSFAIHAAPAAPARILCVRQVCVRKNQTPLSARSIPWPGGTSPS